MDYILGVDGGNTKTDYYLFDSNGHIVGMHRDGTCSHERMPNGFEDSYRLMKEVFDKFLPKYNLKPQDINGYTVLDIIFDGAKEVELIAKPYSITDDSGNVITGNTFIVRSVDENGEVYECPVKHSRGSDKVLLNMLLK